MLHPLSSRFPESACSTCVGLRDYVEKGLRRGQLIEWGAPEDAWLARRHQEVCLRGR